MTCWNKFYITSIYQESGAYKGGDFPIHLGAEIEDAIDPKTGRPARFLIIGRLDDEGNINYDSTLNIIKVG